MVLSTQSISSLFALLVVSVIACPTLLAQGSFQPSPASGQAQSPTSRVTNQVRQTGFQQSETAPANRQPNGRQTVTPPRQARQLQQPQLRGRLGAAQQKPQPPLTLSGYYKLQEGSNQGYLILEASMSPGSYIYSTTQGGNLRPSVITPLPSAKRNYLTRGNFQAMDQPIIVKHDSVMKQRVEKHKGVARFAIEFQIQPGTHPKDVTAMIQFDGQVCSDQGVCMPIRGKEVTAEFAGYIKKPATQPNSATGATTRAGNARPGQINPNQFRTAGLPTERSSRLAPVGPTTGSNNGFQPKTTVPPAGQSNK